MCPSRSMETQRTNGKIGREGFLTEYKCLFATSRTNDRECPLPPGDVYWAYGQGHSTTAAHGEPGINLWFLWERVEPVQKLYSPKYTESDAEAFVHKYADRKMCGDWTVQDAWNARISGALVSQEEGILDQWSCGRVVLVGDAVHKVSVFA